MRRPTIALAMMDGLLSSAFTDAHLARLEEVGTLLNPVPLSNFHDERAAAVLATTEVLVGHWGCPTLTEEVLELAPTLELFAYAAGTVKWQITEAADRRGLLVTSGAAANARPVAEWTLAMVLLANKSAFSYAARERDPSSGVKIDPTSVSNLGKRVGLVGASVVGRLGIELLRPIDLEVAVADPYLDETEALRLGVAKLELDELCCWCDVLSLHAPDMASTKHMIGAAQLGALHDGATVINSARGALIDPVAVEHELVSGRMSAILDVTEPEPLPADSVLRRLDNCVLTPHIAGSMGTELYRMADLAVEEVERFARGEAPRYPVRFADFDRIA